MHEQIDRTIDILLVDDREDGLITLEALLKDEPNYNLVKVRSGAEAIRELPKHDFAMILLDVQMPELDGFQTAEIIRGMTRFRSIPIVFVTAINKDDRYVIRGYEAGAVDYIFKPFDPMILRSKVAVFAEMHLQNRKILDQGKRLVESEALEHRAFMQSLELENLRRYRGLADAIPHIVMRATEDGLVEYHNQLWSTYTGLTPAESLNGGWRKAVDARDLPGLLHMGNDSIAQRKGFEAECRLRRHDGVYRWHWFKAMPAVDDQGKVESWIATCTDIHDRKLAEQNFLSARKQAEAASNAKTHFLANMSHEIRTPLNAIMGFTELLLDPNISMEEKMKSVSIVRRNGHQLLKIVDEILDISKVEAGGLLTEKVDTNIIDLLKEIKALMSIQAAKKKVDLIFDFGPRMPTAVVTDSTRLRQVLLNIVGNAIKFTEKGTVKLLTRYLTNKNGDSIMHFEVSDTGVGIEPESSEKIFEPFSQADASTTRIYGGTGLGLALSRRLARALGGDVRLGRSQPGHGSTFEIEIKVELPAFNEWVSGEEISSEVPAETAAKPWLKDELAGKRILLVEDAEDNQFLIKQFLNRTGAIVEIANNGQEGIDKAMANEFDVVLMDIQMPLVDGYQATSRLRKAGYKVPIIALTAHALVEEREKSLATGCNGHLTKPIDRKQLIDRLVEITT
jgi:two-component system, sensor histidine kinase